MPTHRPCAILILGLLAAVPAGCDRGLGLGGTRNRPRKTVIPAGVVGTVAQYADLVGADEMLARGFGVVVGLGQAGSDEMPRNVRAYLVREMLRQGLASYKYGTESLTPRQMLKDKDTAAVIVAGRIPPAAPPGTRFDLHVEVLPKSQTTSLDGAILLSTKLRLALTTAGSSVGKGKTWALGRGEVFVNPFVDRTKPAEQAKLRAGRIPGGGIVTRPRPLRLVLRRADYRMASLIGRQLNERLGGSEDIAEAKSHSVIDLRIPRQWRADYAHFLELVMHVYLLGGAADEERHAKQLTRAILQPTARHEDISLVWEAMGRRVLALIQALYASPNPAAAYYATRAGLRLQDPLALDAMVGFALHANTPHQIPAIRELGRARWAMRPVHTLRRMLSTPNELVRVAAYEALLDHGPSSAIQRIAVSRDFFMDVVDTEQHYAVYATRTGQPKIVLFGRNIPVLCPMFYSPPDELVTINALAGGKQVTVYRKIPRTGRMTGAFPVDPQAQELVKKLGSPPEPAADGSIKGLGLTYSQVVGVIHALCKGKHMPADFVLQRTPAVARIYLATPGRGRSDMPED